MDQPLAGLLVLEFCQFMAGPSAGLKLADLGARVIKIERPEKGEGGRQIAIKNLYVDDDSLVFHTINRNKESYAADLKDAGDLAMVKKLIARADVMTHNFRPGVMDKIGLNYEQVCAINPTIVYCSVTGYGNKGPWALKPGQDLLVQALSGLAYLSGTEQDGPVPMGIAAADMMCGAHLTQGILAALIKRGKTKKSVLVEVSLLESVLDLQFEVLTTYLNDSGQLPRRSTVNGSGHAYLSAPYGIYQTNDNYLALAMGDMDILGGAIGVDLMLEYPDPALWFDKRDEILVLLADILKKKSTSEWVAIFEAHGIWCAEVFNYAEVMEHEGYRILEMQQDVTLPGGATLPTTRCPIRINGNRLYSAKPFVLH